MNYVIDTNILVIYLRDNAQARDLEKDLKLFSGNHNLIVSVVTVGELRSIALQRNWGKSRLERMEIFLENLLITEIHVEEIVNRYAEIDAFSQGKLLKTQKKVSFTARNMGKNDLWIAATASVLEATLLTTDKDFEHLKTNYISLDLIDLNEYK